MTVQTKNTRESIRKYAAIGLAGLIAGALAMLVTLGLYASERDEYTHYVNLMQTIGLPYTVLVGLWSAWVRRSARWVIVSVVAGFFLGVAWSIWVDLFPHNELQIFIVGPCLLGACVSAIHGWTKQPTWAASFVRLIARSLKGIVAGLALGVVATVVFQMIDSIALPGMMINRTFAFVAAMTFSSCIFLITLNWAGEFSRLPARANSPIEV